MTITIKQVNEALDQLLDKKISPAQYLEIIAKSEAELLLESKSELQET